MLVPGVPALRLLSVAQGLRMALYKGLHATSARLVQKVAAEAGPGSRALQVELTKMLNVP